MDNSLVSFVKKLRLFLSASTLIAILVPSILSIVLYNHLIEHGDSFTDLSNLLLGILLFYLLCTVGSFFFIFRWIKLSITEFEKRHNNIQSLQETVIKEKEEGLHKQVYFLETLINTISSPVFFKDANMVYLGCNREFERVLGLRKEDIIGKTVFDIAPKELAQIYHDADMELFSSKGTQQYESKVLYADGTKHDVLFYKSVFTDTNNKPAGIIGIMLDITERKKMEGIISDKENLYMRVFDESPLGKFMLDADSMRFCKVNSVLCNMLGYNKEEMLTLAVLDITYPEDKENTQTQIDKLVNREKSHITYEKRYIKKDGTKLWVRVHSSLIKSALEPVVYVLGAVEDISLEKQTQEMTKLNDELMMSLINRSIYGILVVDEKGVVLFANPMAERIFMKGNDELIGTQFGYPINPEGDLAEIDIIRCDGSIATAKISACNFQWRERKVFLVFVNDITEEKKALEGIRLFREALNRAGDSILIVDPLNTQIIDTNETACKVHGYSREEMLSLKIKDIHPQLEPVQLWRHFEAVIERQEIAVIETLSLKKNGREFPVEIFMSSLIFENRPIIVAVIRDITERSRMQQELIKAREQALEASRLKSEFVANMSHEIRTPLNGIIGIIDLLAQSSSNIENRDMLNTLKESSNVLMAIINDVLDFSKIEAGKLTIDHDAFNPLSLVENTTDIVSLRAYEKGLMLATYIDKGTPIKLLGAPMRLKQVLLNLINNAVKFTDRGSVTVRVSPDHSEDEFIKSLNMFSLRFEIADTGIGMDETTQARIFEPFMQADGSFSRPYSGTGLGLYISKRLIELMGGDIAFRSVPAKGTTFTFSIPFVMPTYIECWQVPEPLKGRFIKAAIVSDREAESIAIEQYLQDYHISYTRFRDCQGALDSMIRAFNEGESFDIAIINMNCRCELKCKVAEEKKINPALMKTRFIFVTFEDKNFAVSEHFSAFDGFIRRPMKKDHLFFVITEVLTKRQEKDASKTIDVAAVKTHEETSGQVKGQDRSILLVEDNFINQKVALMQLRKLGYSADIANNGKEALDALASKTYDLVLMDCQMPLMDGFEATKNIRIKETLTGLHIPIIAMTANALEGDRDKCLESGMDDYISKPVNITSLKEKIQRWLR